MKRVRLDQLVVERGLAESREQAQRLIRAGEVSADGHPATKPGQEVSPDAAVTVRTAPRFVSRGGEKLEAAFPAFSLDVTGLDCLDVGASTGGFTDCLLQHGAARVAALDVGRGQLHWRIRQDPRVVVIEGLNARYLRPGDVPFRPAFAVLDVSFISLTLVLPPVIDVLTERAGLVTLIKPQFEAGRGEVRRGGVVRDPAVRQAVVSRIREFGCAKGLQWVGVVDSPLPGPAGNVELLAYWKKGVAV
jgi:23S rRNA (cytidine1920-2'-O)/16S rRNA (cytidine1409-2'-O)-methyltransferase